MKLNKSIPNVYESSCSEEELRVKVPTIDQTNPRQIVRLVSGSTASVPLLFSQLLCELPKSKRIVASVELI